MATGKIRMIEKERGFGFIRRPDVPDLFFHLSECGQEKEQAKSAFDAYGIGDEVVFEEAEGKRGPEARDVRPTDDA